ncbi:conserved hypothetical protein [Ricinus communis]|uniref:Uncharacterized protein n=1 Tax=Ricinus communis TaxID=3988 RepID=B9SEX5_RICCO|nr:conserved hypothetical protein [Ricinus communis]
MLKLLLKAHRKPPDRGRKVSAPMRLEQCLTTSLEAYEVCFMRFGGQGTRFQCCLEEITPISGCLCDGNEQHLPFHLGFMIFGEKWRKQVVSELRR